MNRKTIGSVTAIGMFMAAGSAFAGAGFSIGTTLNAPTRPAAAAVADFNGDQLADVAVTTDTPDKISIFTNTGSGFSGPVNIQTGGGSSPDSLIATDLDGDGDQDLVVALKNINTVRAYINNGGAFIAGPSATVGPEPRGMSMGNLDNAGGPDFAVANEESNTISTVRYLNGAFVSATFTVGQEPRGTAIADLNGDGLGDVVATNHDDRNLTVLRNLGGGALGGAVTLNIGNPYRPEGVTTLDIDGDGDRDIAAVASDDTVVNRVAIFVNTGGAFSGPTFYSTGGIDASSIVAADLDADGDADVAVTNSTSNTLAVLANNGGSLGAPTTLATGTYPDHVTAANVSGSGSPELIVSNRDSNTVSIFNNNTPPACAADFDGDGFVTGLDFDQYVGAFEAGSLTADFDGDGFITGIDFDLYVGAFEAGC